MKIIKVLAAFLLFIALSYFYLFFKLPSNGVLLIRLTRYALCIFTGFSLSMNGAVLQTITQNPLVEPYLIGTSGGALMGYIVGLALHISSPFFLSIPAFVFAIFGMIVTYTLASIKNSVKSDLLVLSGIFVNLFASSIVFLSAYFLHLSLDQIIYMLFGSMNIILTRKELYPFFISLATGTILELFLLSFSREFDLIAVGEDEAHSTGVHPERIKKIVLVITSLTTAFIVSFTGIIGFVGLVIPHITRSIAGKKHLSYLPVLFFTGGAFLLGSDFIAKSLFSFELPIGSVTTLLGIPFFFYMIIKNRNESI